MTGSTQNPSWRLGLLWGAAATLAMTMLMLLATGTGFSPMPRPIPVAIMGSLLGPSLAQPAVMGLAFLAHFGYGGVWGAAYASLWRPPAVWKGLVLGVGLWVLMGLIVLPALGWGLFGSQLDPRIALATLLLHLVYGLVVGLGLGVRGDPAPGPAVTQS